MTGQGWIVGLDIGGTFTDVYMLQPGTGLSVGFKSLTTPEDPARGADEALAGALDATGAKAPQIEVVLHATTLVANALIERIGAVTALITTEGFRDLLHIAREKKFDIYDIFLDKPTPIVPPERSFGVHERIAADGGVIEPLDESSVAAVVGAIAASGTEAVAVCTLHSYVNPAHERKIGEAIRARLPGVAVTLSSELLPEMREYERATTTTANAFVLPLIDGYLDRLAGRLRTRGIGAAPFIMLSSGGLATAEVVRRFPIRICESGPAAGAVTAGCAGSLAGAREVLSFDMGGTTAKASLIHDGSPLVTNEFEAARIYRFKKGSGLPLRIPVVDLIEIGAGGGSIAHVDELGLLKVGPLSAGAEPGPACYARGGGQATVTDADLVLGYLGAESFLGGRMHLDCGMAEQAIEHDLARPLGATVAEAALGVHAIVNENMANAARIHAAERGYDPARYTMVAFGGAGPVHAWDVARRLGIARFIVPPAAGVGSALGLQLAPRSYRLSRTLIGTLEDLDWAEVDAAYDEMTREVCDVLAAAGVKRREISYTRQADMRYRGQRRELAVDLPAGRLTSRKKGAIRDAFEKRYRDVFRRIHNSHRIEALTWRLVADGPPIVSVTELGPPNRDGTASARPGRRPMLFEGWDRPQACRVYARQRLGLGKRVRGPASIEESHATTVIGPGAVAVVDEHANLVVTLTRGRSRHG